jgi:hypothetical protein
MEEQIHLSATNGTRCKKERHHFRIGLDVREATEFSANENDFFPTLLNAIIDHGFIGKRWASGPKTYAFLQVHCGSYPTGKQNWGNIQNPATGNVVAITPKITVAEASVIFEWACNAVQMTRDIESIVHGLTQLSSDHP